MMIYVMHAKLRTRIVLNGRCLICKNYITKKEKNIEIYVSFDQKKKEIYVSIFKESKITKLIFYFVMY